MKRGLTIAAIIGGMSLFGYAIYQYFVKQVALLKQFDWKVLDFTFDVADLQTIKGKIAFRFISISDLELTINKFYLDVYINGDRIGYIEDLSPFIIPANGYTDIPFEYTVDPQYVLKNIVDIISYSTKSKDAIITFNGYAQIGGGIIKATLPIKTDCSIKSLDCKMG